MSSPISTFFAILWRDAVKLWLEGDFFLQRERSPGIRGGMGREAEKSPSGCKTALSRSEAISPRALGAIPASARPGARRIRDVSEEDAARRDGPGHSGPAAHRPAPGRRMD